MAERYLQADAAQRPDITCGRRKRRVIGTNKFICQISLCASVLSGSGHATTSFFEQDPH